MPIGQERSVGKHVYVRFEIDEILKERFDFVALDLDPLRVREAEEAGGTVRFSLLDRQRIAREAEH